MELLTPSFGLIFWTLLAFLIVFYILRKFAWKPILTMLGEREKGIAEAIATADKVKAEMSQMQNENEKLMVQAREERALTTQGHARRHQVVGHEVRQLLEPPCREAGQHGALVGNRLVEDDVELPVVSRSPQPVDSNRRPRAVDV